MLKIVGGFGDERKMATACLGHEQKILLGRRRYVVLYGARGTPDGGPRQPTHVRTEHDLTTTVKPMIRVGSLTIQYRSIRLLAYRFDVGAILT